MTLPEATQDSEMKTLRSSLLAADSVIPEIHISSYSARSSPRF